MYSGKRNRNFSSGSSRKLIKNRIITAMIAVLVGMTIACAIYGAFTGEKTKKNTEIPNKITQWIQNQMVTSCMPVFAFIEEETGIHRPSNFLKQALSEQFLIYGYSQEQSEEYVSTEDEDTYDLLIRQEGTDEERKDIEDGSLEYENDALHIDGDLERAMMEENNLHNQENQEEEKENEGKEEEKVKEPLDDFQVAGNKSYEYDWNELTDYDDIVSAFYAIDKTTSITDSQLNLDTLMKKDMKVKGSAENPQILIYHTHSQEGFVDSVAGDPSTTIVGAGDKLAQLLRDEYGYNVLHHTGEYDVEARDYAYSNALPAIEQLLAENPTIEVVIDLHRDAVAEGRKLAVNMKGRPTAQFMFFNGLSRTKQNGEISYLENPYINDNLAFSFQAQVASNEYYPGIARRIYLRAYRYNMHLRAKSMLVELGAQTNTVEEIMNACDPLAHVIAIVLGALQ